jgi:hypothetical protein
MDSKVNVIPTIYYIGLSGISYLKTRKECEKAYLAKLYKEKTKSKQFIHRRLLIADIYLDLLKTYPSSNFDFYTQSDFKLDSVIRNILPDFALKMRTEDKFTVCELFKEKIPRFAIRSRIENYLTFFTEGEWITNEKPPFLIFACPSEEMKKYVQRHAKSAMEEIGTEEISCSTVTYQEMQNFNLEEIKNREE